MSQAPGEAIVTAATLARQLVAGDLIRAPKQDLSLDDRARFIALGALRKRYPLDSAPRLARKLGFPKDKVLDARRAATQHRHNGAVANLAGRFHWFSPGREAAVIASIRSIAAIDPFDAKHAIGGGYCEHIVYVAPTRAKKALVTRRHIVNATGPRERRTVEVFEVPAPGRREYLARLASPGYSAMRED